MEHKKTTKEETPRKKMNTRGMLNVGGMTDFNPDANVRLTRQSEADRVSGIQQKKKKGCCGS